MKMFIEIEVDVEYDYQPFEAQTLNYPGCDASIENVSVVIGNYEITNHLDVSTTESINNQCWIELLESQQEQE